jgi:hypothetical protein
MNVTPLMWGIIRYLVEAKPHLSNRTIAQMVYACLGVHVDGRTVAGFRHSRRYQKGKAMEKLAA